MDYRRCFVNQVTSHCSVVKAIGCRPMNPHLIWLSLVCRWWLVEEYSENCLSYTWECLRFLNEGVYSVRAVVSFLVYVYKNQFPVARS